MGVFIKEDENFKLYSKEHLYHHIKGLIKNKITNEVFEGEVKLYKHLVNNEWVYDDNIYEALPHSSKGEDINAK